MAVRRLRWVCSLVVLAAGRVPADDAIRCDGGLVTVGDAALDVAAKCGPPALREEHLVERGASWREGAPGVTRERRDVSVVERWTYNFGPDRFIQIVTLAGGKVRHVEHGGYGYPPERLRPGPTAGPSRCEPDLRLGDTTLDVLAKCGEPALRDRRDEQRAVLLDAAGGEARVARTATVAVETWTYDLGPDRLLVIATLEDGKVVSLDRGGYGYAR
jgi:hypothetical protein